MQMCECICVRVYLAPRSKPLGVRRINLQISVGGIWMV